MMVSVMVIQIISRIEGGESSDWMNGELNNVNLTEFFRRTSPGNRLKNKEKQ